MECRKKCGACCIVPSISEPFLGMPGGKPAGVPCVHLDLEKNCTLFGDVRRPDICKKYLPERQFCGDSVEKAFENLEILEKTTLSLEQKSIGC